MRSTEHKCLSQSVCVVLCIHTYSTPSPSQPQAQPPAQGEYDLDALIALVQQQVGEEEEEEEEEGEEGAEEEEEEGEEEGDDRGA